MTQVPWCWPHTAQPLSSLILGPGAGPSSTCCTWAQVALQMALKGLAWVLHLHAVLQPGPGIGEKAPYRRLITLKQESFPPTNIQEWPTRHGPNCPEFGSVSRDTGARAVLYLPPSPLLCKTRTGYNGNNISELFSWCSFCAVKSFLSWDSQLVEWMELTSLGERSRQPRTNGSLEESLWKGIVLNYKT